MAYFGLYLSNLAFKLKEMCFKLKDMWRRNNINGRYFYEEARWGSFFPLDLQKQIYVFSSVSCKYTNFTFVTQIML